MYIVDKLSLFILKIFLVRYIVFFSICYRKQLKTWRQSVQSLRL